MKKTKTSVKKKLSAAESKQRKIAAKTITSALRARGLTTEQAGLDIGCTRKSVERYSSGERAMPGEMRRNFIKAYGIDPDIPYNQQIRPSSDEDVDDIGAALDLEDRSKRNNAEASKPLKTPISPNNPRVAMCLGCGENQHLDDPKCENCEANLTGQLNNQYFDWAAIEHPATNELIRRARWQSVGFLVFSVIPLIFFLFILTVEQTQQLAIKSSSFISPAVVIVLIGSMVLSMALDRKAKRYEKYLDNLHFNDFLRSEHFKTLSRPQR